MRYPETTWALMRSLYMSGQFGTMEELQQTCKKSMKIAVPSLSALQKHSIKYNWNKNELKEKIEKTHEEKVIEEFASVGLEKKDIYQGIVNMIKTPQTATEKREGLKMAIDIVGLNAPRKIDATSNGESLSTEKTIFVIPSNGFEHK